MEHWNAERTRAIGNFAHPRTAKRMLDRGKTEFRFCSTKSSGLGRLPRWTQPNMFLHEMIIWISKSYFSRVKSTKIGQTKHVHSCRSLQWPLCIVCSANRNRCWPILNYSFIIIIYITFHHFSRWAEFCLDRIHPDYSEQRTLSWERIDNAISHLIFGPFCRWPVGIAMRIIVPAVSVFVKRFLVGDHIFSTNRCGWRNVIACIFVQYFGCLDLDVL